MTNKNVPTEENVSNLAASVLERIATEHLVPKHKWHFLVREYGIWVLWALAVVFGAISVAVMLFVEEHARFALYEATHETALSFFVDVLPYMWMLVFIVMLVLAYNNFRHTKRGYRYHIHHIVISSIIFSLLGGTLLYTTGVGALIDTQAGKHLSTYLSMEKMEMRLWQAPREGRLVGTFLEMVDNDTVYVLTDKKNKNWYVETTELRDRDKQLLSSGRLVRVLGTTTDPEKKRFYACGVFPWMFDTDISSKYMREDREDFVSRMYEHKETNERLHDLERETYGSDVKMPFTEGTCGELAVIKRMRF